MERLSEPFSTYQEIQSDGILYCITNEFMGNVDLKTALEDLTVRRVVQEAAFLNQSEELRR